MSWLGFLVCTQGRWLAPRVLGLWDLAHDSRTFRQLLPSTYQLCLHWLIEHSANDFAPRGSGQSSRNNETRGITQQCAISLYVRQDCICIPATKGHNPTSSTIPKEGSKDFASTPAKLFVSTMISQKSHIEHVHCYLNIFKHTPSYICISIYMF